MFQKSESGIDFSFDRYLTHFLSVAIVNHKNYVSCPYGNNYDNLFNFWFVLNETLIGQFRLKSYLHDLLDLLTFCLQFCSVKWFVCKTNEMKWFVCSGWDDARIELACLWQVTWINNWNMMIHLQIGDVMFYKPIVSIEPNKKFGFCSWSH